jgi:membrane protease YdiL (CAAX protease family)
MELQQPVSFPKVTGLIAGLFMRRFGNRMASGFRRRKKGAGERTGTGRKSISNPLGLLAIVVAFLFNSLNISTEAMRTLCSELGPPRDGAGRIEIRESTYNNLLSYTQNNEGGDVFKEPRLEQAFDQVFYNESGSDNPSSKSDYARQLTQVLQEKGLAGFMVVSHSAGFWFIPLHAWDDALLRPALLNSLGLMLLILAGARHCWTLGSRNQDLGQVEWSTEWLFTMPAPSNTLFGAQILGHAFVDPFSWIGTIPFLLVMYRSAGVGWVAAIPMALGNSVYLSMIMASLRVVSETWLRKHLGPARLKNLQAMFTLVGIVLMFLLIATARSREVIQWVVRIAEKNDAIVIWNPFSLPALAFAYPPVAIMGLEVVSAFVIVAGAIWFCSYLVRDGLMGAPSVYSGVRGGVAGRDFLPSGIIGKDLRLLLRDRNFFVQTLVAPVLIVCFQVFFNVGMAQSIASNFQHAATFAFGVGAYVMISTGLNVLAVEGNSLWMLYGLPVALPSIMLRKTTLWSALGLFYAVVVLVICGWHIHEFRGIDVSYALVAMAGVIIYSFIASGIGMLATDPLEVEVKRRIKPGMIYLYMILASLYGYALYAPSTWARLGQIVLSTLLAVALWQKVRDRAPFLLDAVSMPPPRVSLADGLMAALGFFVMQGVVALLFVRIRVAPGTAIVLTYAIAGALVVGFTLLMFWKAKVVGMLDAVGLRGPRDGRRGGSILLGIGLGVAAGVVAFGYLAAIRYLPAIDRLTVRSEILTNVTGWWLPLLAVIVAPIFEEFIFRGLVFRGLRRSLPVYWSMAGSAAVFAICHPPLSFVPVLVMGMFAALGFEMTGWILTPICVHMTYNGLILLTGLLQHGGGM